MDDQTAAVTRQAPKAVRCTSGCALILAVQQSWPLLNHCGPASACMVYQHGDSKAAAGRASVTTGSILCSIPYLRARLAGGCFHMLVYALRTHCSTPKKILYAWLTALLDPQTYCVLHCAGIAQGLEGLGDLICGFAQAVCSGPDCFILHCECSHR